MKVFVGMVAGAEQHRFIFAAEANPSLQNLVVLSDGSSSIYDWGPDADLSACIRLADVILRQIYPVGVDIPVAMCMQFAVKQIRTLQPTTMWIMQRTLVEQFIRDYEVLSVQ
jgi:hypothetical protein